VVLEGLPGDLKHVALGALDASVDARTPEAARLADHGGQTARHGLFESVLLSGSDADIGNF
jgi:hypothetical protein